MSKNWVVLGLGPIAFGIAFGLSLLSDRDVRRASLVGTTALSAAYAGGLVSTRQTNNIGKEILPLHTQLVALQSRVDSLEAVRADFPLPIEYTPHSKKSIPSGQGNVAIFWDYENVRVAAQGSKSPLAESLIAYSESQGHPSIKIAYANWQQERSKYIAQALYSLGFETVHVSTGKANSADIKLAIDCLEVARQYPSIEKFIIVTSDRDFVPLTNILKNTFKKKVVVVGQIEKVNNQLLASAEFIDIRKLDSNEESETISYRDAVECLEKAVISAPTLGKSTRLSVIDQLMRSDTDFSYQGVSSIRKDDGSGFRNFKQFILAAEKDNKVTVSELGEISIPEINESVTDSEVVFHDSEYSPQDLSSITREQWRILIHAVEECVQKEAPDIAKGNVFATYSRFQSIAPCVIQAKVDGQLPHSHKRLQYALNELSEVGVLIAQEDHTFRLHENLDGKLEEFLDKLAGRS